ncbi:MAG: hypothetical protein KGK08_11920 [Acidobacteriota bacterium]|nr:hypothetical protein [Acidobacteriota bacterium]
MMVKFTRCLAAVGALVSFSALVVQARAQAARFDLEGPKIEVRVTRDGHSLPIAYVPNLKAGDRLWLHPDLPPTQSVHYLLVAAFLRGTTNPPPDEWFVKIETWNRKVRDEGVFVPVPAEAQQAILFLAPETGGDFTTLRAAVRGRPGVFVRASQDLSEAGFEQARIEKYLASIRQVPPSDPKALLEHSNLLARTLNLKPSEECFKQPVDLQYNCLTQSGNQTLLDDGHAQSIISSLASGPNSDFINAASYTAVAGGGAYSAYVGAVVDLVRIMGGLHTAQYQYIPAIAFPAQESLNLRLNTPPSFRNPKSVIVIGLPSIQTAVPPPLRPADPKFVTCLLKPRTALPVEGAPLVFSTSFAHGLALHIDGTPSAQDLPLVPDAYHGGLVVSATHERRRLAFGETASDPPPPPPTPKTTLQPLPGAVIGTIVGYWGFDAFSGPSLQLQREAGTGWKISSDEPVIAGHEAHLLLTSTGSACIKQIDVLAGSHQTHAAWKPTDSPNEVEVTLPPHSTDPGSFQLAVQQYTLDQPTLVAGKAFSEPATLNAVHIHAGDTTALVSGTNLEQVQQFSIGSFLFAPMPVAPVVDADSTTAQPASADTLQFSLAQGVAAPHVRSGEHVNATFTLKDGRTLIVVTTVEPARPAVSLLSKSISQPADPLIHLSSQDDLPANQTLVFSLRSATPFPRTARIEVASADDSLHASLTVSSGSLVLQNPHTLLGTLDPLKAFGTSAFGPLRLRAVAPDGTTGDWIPLATLIRLPTVTGLHCPSEPAAPCTLSGSDLYLIDSIASDAAFTNTTPVPEGFVGTTLSVDRPADLPRATRTVNVTLYLKLRDDPSTVNTLVLPVAVTAPPRASHPTAEPAGTQPSNPAPTPPAAPSSAESAAPASAPAQPPASSSPAQVPGSPTASPAKL